MMEEKGVEEVSLRLDAPDFQPATVLGVLCWKPKSRSYWETQHWPVYTSLGLSWSA